MDCNLSFNGRLVVDNLTKNNNRWKNIAKIFKEETKGIDYESRISDDNDTLEIYVDRIVRKNRKYDVIDDINTRQTILTEKDTQDLLSQSDNDIAKILAKHLQFIKKSDENYKQADNLFNKICEICDEIGINTDYEYRSISDSIVPKILPEYKFLKTLPGFKDAKFPYIDYVV